MEGRGKKRLKEGGEGEEGGRTYVGRREGGELKQIEGGERCGEGGRTKQKR